MPPKKTRKIASTQSDFSKSLGEKQMRTNSFLSLKMVFEDTIVRINTFIDNMFIIEMFNEHRYIIGFKNKLVANIPNLESQTELQKAEIKLVTYVVVYFAHILVALSKLSEPFSEEELEYIMEKMDAFMELTHLNFLHPLPADMKPTCMRGVKHVLQTIFNINEFQISGLSTVDMQTLEMYNGYPLSKIIESINDAYAIKRAEIVYRKDKEEQDKQKLELKKQAELAEAKALAEQAEAELLASLSASSSNKKKQNRTQKNKASALGSASVTASALGSASDLALGSASDLALGSASDLAFDSASVQAPLQAPLKKPSLSEKELRKIEADEKNRLRQLEEKQRREDEQKRRNEEIMKKFAIPLSEATMPSPKKTPSPTAVEVPLPTVEVHSPVVEPPLPTVEVHSPVVEPPLPTVEVHSPTPLLINYFPQEQLKQLRAYIMTGKAAKQIEAEFPNMKFTETADDAYKMIVRSTLFILSELTRATGYPIFCLKGGKIVQLTQSTPYISDDIDILVLDNSHRTANQIADFVKSMFVGLPISILDKSLMTPTAANQNIIKMSYGKTHFKAFLDIDFSQTPAYSQMFFDNLFPIPFGSLLFVAQSHLQFIDEKIFFYELYSIKCKEQQHNPYRQNICNYILSKFKRVIDSLIQSTEIYEKRVEFLRPYIENALPQFQI